MKWSVNFYDRRVEKDISEWPKQIRAKFVWIVDLIEDLGPEHLGMPYVKPMKQGLFEIRAKGTEGIGRAFFCMKGDRIVVILSGFIKKNPENSTERNRPCA